VVVSAPLRSCCSRWWLGDRQYAASCLGASVVVSVMINRARQVGCLTYESVVVEVAGRATLARVGRHGGYLCWYLWCEREKDLLWLEISKSSRKRVVVVKVGACTDVLIQCPGPAESSTTVTCDNSSEGESVVNARHHNKALFRLQ
jgi:hypothetical protein